MERPEQVGHDGGPVSRPKGRGHVEWRDRTGSQVDAKGGCIPHTLDGLALQAGPFQLDR
jgi:hypothetical protein